jgi:hypothetical protein
MYRFMPLLPLMLSIMSLVMIPAQGIAQVTPTPPPIAIQVDGATVTGTGLTPGGSVAILAGWWFNSRGASNLTNTARAGIADGSGSFSTTLHLPVPEGALLAVLDTASGRVAVLDVGTPRFSRLAIPEKRFKRDAERDVDTIQSPHDTALIVVMRPGVGIWAQNAGDGGNRDDDAKADGSILTVPEKMMPLAGSPAAPRKIKHKDVVLLVDALAGIFASTEVAE